jgi:hypothetical protein
MSSLPSFSLASIKAFFLTPLERIPGYLKEALDEFLSLNTIHKITTVLVLIYFAIPPLLYQADPVQFHVIKLNTMYVTGVTLLLVVLFGYQHFPHLGPTWRFFRRGRLLVLLAVLFMFFSLAINFSQMNLFVRAGIITTPVFYGAGPNFISIFYYWLAFVLFFIGPVVYPHLPMKFIQTIVFTALFITGILIAYQVLVDDFMGISRTYLFGFGNTNYTPDPFAIFGLYLTIPLLYKKEINPYTLLLGLFFFVIVLLSISRASWVGVFVAIVASIGYLIWKKKLDYKRFGLLSLTAVIAFFVILSVLLFFGEDVIVSNFESLLRLFRGESNLAETSSNRTLLWFSAIEMWLYGVADGTEVFRLNWASIFFGNGQSVYLWLEGDIQYLVTNVHQMYLDVLMSGGIVVFAVFIYLIYTQILFAYRLVQYNLNYLILFSGLIFTLTKWFFNSLNGLHAPFVYTTFLLITSLYYLNHKKIKQVNP